MPSQAVPPISSLSLKTPSMGAREILGGLPKPPAALEAADVIDISSAQPDGNLEGNMGDETVAYQESKKALEKAQRKHLEAAQKKQRKDQNEKPTLTGVTKIRTPEVLKLIRDCLVKDTFSSLKKPVDPQIGDLYIYKCGAKEPVLNLDQTQWYLTHSDQRQNQALMPGRKYEQCTYRTSQDMTKKKILFVDNHNGVVVVHYR